MAQALQAGDRADSRTGKSGRGHGDRISGTDTDGQRDDSRGDRTDARVNQPASQRTGNRPRSRLYRSRPRRPRATSASRSVPTRPLRPPSGGRPRLPVPLAVATVASTGGVTALIRSPLARRMLEVVLAEPVLLSAEERYLHGHYLAYLLSGSRRRGLFLRRPLEPRNADRGRLLLGLTYAIIAGGGEEAIRDAAALLDQRIEVRSILSPIVVAKYLACRESPAKRKLFRQTRKALGQASKYAQKHMIDAKGVLNPGLMPQRLEDLHLLAPPRDDVDDVLVERWNRVTEVWRNEVEFRTAVLALCHEQSPPRPGQRGLVARGRLPLDRACPLAPPDPPAHRSGMGLRLRPVARSRCRRCARPGASRSVPAPLVAQIDDEMRLFVDNPRLDNVDSDPFAAGSRDQADRLAASLSTSRADLANLAAELAIEPDKEKSLLPLADPDPLRFFQGQLHELWKEAIAVLQSQAQARPGAKPASHRHVAGRPVPTDRHPVPSRPGRRPDRHPGHDQ